ncbi:MULTISPECIES: lysophospholipid acyltransferase family protein [unclassified Chelatococcus]|uniref:lysophospholipid acyltransferase family protein n=1 Tax=unclassified Chelatococcus TaxID=2638111 RepID=UPI001BCB48B0|nr:MULTISPECIES: lysophospholipid acyltransferase family protein [unclassified Chelatococcus]MBS7695800.1 lysophospholipid acyltransferase family protein [Chelatococcus sp. YT9]MBX3555825.1 lysophospholipid acyltransferase family protein [Chelatococcus sp.]
MAKPLKRLLRSRPVQSLLGHLLAGYLRLVQRTNTFVWDRDGSADAAYARIGPLPVIVAMWHGQHFMIPFAKRPGDPAAALVSRHGDGEFNAIALARLGIRAIRGSGARGTKVREKGGAAALRGLLKTLADGEMVVLTADIPKVSRVCGEGIVMLSRLSGRPVVPVAVVTSRRIDFRSWDRASIGLPFGRGVIAVGDAITVPRDADPETLEACRLRIEEELDAVHARAYGGIGTVDPGARSMAADTKSHAA